MRDSLIHTPARIHTVVLLFLALLFSPLLDTDTSWAVVYEVGPGKPYATISQVPLESIVAGDVVRIHWQSTPYREKWVIAAAGSESHPVVFEGVANASGELPIIDGENATTRLQLDYWNENRSVIKIGGSSIPSGTPAYVTVRNLDVRSGRPPYTFTDDAGNPGSYSTNAAAIHIESGSHITIENCIIHNCGNGLFASYTAQQVIIRGCYIYDNGNVGSIYEHNTYTEAAGILYEYNHFGPLRSGCSGNNLKDRSAGTVIRYNWIESGNRQLDLVETDYSVLRNRPDYDSTFVYGNILIEHEGDGNNQILHFGGDGGNTSMYRRNLYFYHNTIVSTRSSSNTTLMRLSTNDQRAHAANNIIYVAAAGSRMAMLDASGQLHLYANYLKPSWKNSHSGLDPGATVTVEVANIEAASPGFVDENNQDYRLSEGSVCLSSAIVLSAHGLPRPEVTHEYQKHQTVRLRLAQDDLGALDFRAVRLAVRLFLQGLYNTMTQQMNPTLHPILPLDAPYSSAPRHIDAMPAGIVDWILLQLRDSRDDDVVVERSFLLRQDGQVVDFNQYSATRSTLLLPLEGEGSYYLTAKHRNHVAAISQNRLDCSQAALLDYDFTESDERYYGSHAAIELEAGRWALWGGDCNQDGMVTSKDYVRWYNAVLAGDNGYFDGTDFNGDANLSPADFSLWLANAQQGARCFFAP